MMTDMAIEGEEGGLTESVLLRWIVGKRALDVSASEPLRAWHSFGVCGNAR
jgi:hypothetical protein